MELWEHQKRGIEQFWEAVNSGQNRIVICAPPRSGKTILVARIVAQALAQNWPVVIYSHRIMLTEQLKEVFEGQGFHFGIRASGFEPAMLRNMQISSMPTEAARLKLRDDWKLHPAKLVVTDECHLQSGKRATAILNAHVEQGAVILGLSATPVRTSHLYKHLIAVATNSELRACGSHVPCFTYAPSEIDIRGLMRTSTGEYKGLGERVCQKIVFGNIVDHWRRLNPDGKPTILFAPGVKESRWFCDMLTDNGIPAGHIDGEMTKIGGDEYPSDRSSRKDLLEMSKAGEIKVLCNRFVCREALDLPWIHAGICATVFSGEHTYVQAGSRILTASPGKTKAIWLDHGGNYWRYGSLNEDRVWKLTDTPRALESRRAKRLQRGQDQEGIVCPKCSCVRRKGPECPNCSYRHPKSMRVVIQKDGTLQPMEGQARQMKKTRKDGELARLEKCWFRAYFAMLNSKKNSTMAQVAWYYRKLAQTNRLPLTPSGKGYWYNVPSRGSACWRMPVKAYDKLLKERRIAKSQSN